MITARSTPNIALIKYWGNRHEELRIPAADSLSMTLSIPDVEITVGEAEAFSVRSFDMDSGEERVLAEKDQERFRTHLRLTQRYLEKLGAAKALPDTLAIAVRSRIPSSIGLASSAAVFSCLARAYAGLVSTALSLTDEQTSVIARLGSGSAARGIYGGFSAIVTTGSDEIDSAYSVQIADEHHWNLYDIIIAPSTEAKKYGSTEGHSFAPTSPYYKDRLAAMPRRQKEAIDAVLHRDFEKLQLVAEEDCMDMHSVMRSSTPSLNYLSERTYLIVDDIVTLRKDLHLPVLFTMDAGPTVHLFCTEEALTSVRDYAAAQTDCTIFESTIGRGAYVVE